MRILNPIPNSQTRFEHSDCKSPSTRTSPTHGTSPGTCHRGLARTPGPCSQPFAHGVSGDSVVVSVVADVPPAPQRPLVVDFTSRSAVLSWAPRYSEADTPPLSYVLQKRYKMIRLRMWCYNNYVLMLLWLCSSMTLVKLYFSIPAIRAGHCLRQCPSVVYEYIKLIYCVCYRDVCDA